MKESLAPLHVHELSPEPQELPKAANDNEKELPAPVVAANDNEVLQRITAIRENLGIEEEEETNTSDEKMETVRVDPEEIGQNAPEEPRAAQASGGRMRDDSGTGRGEGGDRDSGKGEKNASGALKNIGKLLKSILLAPVWAFGALFALAMNGVMKGTNRFLNTTKLGKGNSGGSSKPSGGHGGGSHGH